MINGDRPRPMPMALGHEAAGVVEQLGDGVQDLAVGDHVVLVFVPSCGHCHPCAEGRPALCEPGAAANGAGSLLYGARRLTRNGQTIHHHLGCSAFATYAVVSRRSAIEIDHELPFEHAALFGCAVLTGVGAVVNTAQVRAGTSVAVIGLGGVGLASVLGAAAAGARHVIAVDLADDKLALAQTLGATGTFNAGAANVIEAIRDATRGGVDTAIEMAGSTRAFDLAYRITRRGGMTVTAGLPPPDATWAMPAVNLVAEERTIKGSYVGTCVPMRDIPATSICFAAGACRWIAYLAERLRSTTSIAASICCTKARRSGKLSCFDLCCMATSATGTTICRTTLHLWLESFGHELARRCLENP